MSWHWGEVLAFAQNHAAEDEAVPIHERDRWHLREVDLSFIIFYLLFIIYYLLFIVFIYYSFLDTSIEKERQHLREVDPTTKQHLLGPPPSS